MKANLKYQFLRSLISLILFLFITTGIAGQQAVVSLPAGIGLNCGAGNSTDSFRVMNYNDAANTLNLQYKCFPNLGGGSPAGPSFSSSAGSIAFNPKDQNIYYIATTNGNNSFVYHWRPDTCPTSQLVYSNYYNNQFVVGLDFTSSGTGYQLEFTGSGPYIMYLRKVNFATNTFGQADTIILSSHSVNSQNGDIIMTPLGQLYFCFDNKLYQVDYSNYGNAAMKDNATYIDSIRVNTAGDYLTGIAYAHGKFIASIQHLNSTPCYWKEIDISTGTAVLSNITLPNNNYTATDMATIITGIGAAKKVTGAGPLGGNVWGIQYDIKVRNYGNANLNNVQLVDSVKKVFGVYFTSASVAAVGSLPAGLTINPSYNGNTNCNIFVGGAGSTLSASPADSATVRVSVFLNNPPLNTTFYNTSIASAQSVLFSQSVLDSSNNDPSLRSDLNSNGVPDDAGENVPTPFILNNWTSLANKILDFNGSLNNNSVNLHWGLENTEGMLTINIQKSIDGKDFQTFGTLTGIEAIEYKNYYFSDNKLNNKDNYYRLECIPVNGIPFYSGIVIISLKDRILLEINVHPNPFTEEIQFSITLPQSDVISYKLFDLQSRLKYSSEQYSLAGENNFRINTVSNLPPGMYLLQVKVGNAILNKKIVKAP